MTHGPVWVLDDLYKGLDDPALAADLKTAEAEVLRFVQDYEGRLGGLEKADVAKAIQRYEAIQVGLAKPAIYAHLVFAADMSVSENKTFYQTMQEKVVALSSPLLFFTVELNELPEAALGGIEGYGPWLKEVRAFAPYQLPKAQEQLLHEMSIASRSNWVRLHEETLADERFAYRDQMLPISDVLNLFVNPDGEVRKDAALAFAKGLESNAMVLSLVFNTLVKEKEIEDKWRSFKSPIQSRNVANMVEDEVVEALVETVRGSYECLSHRYYTLKAKWMGKDRLAFWDRNAPLPFETPRRYTWEEARDLVLASYRDFSPQMADIGSLFFENNWIDAALRPGKDSGAFSASAVPEVHPYILMNFHGNLRDVSTLAHELGHGVHQYLSRSQGYLLSQTPLTVAETASVFGEMLTFQRLLKSAKSVEETKALLASKIEDMLNTVVRQIAFCTFEKRVHEARRHQELSPQELGQIWLATQRESLGPIFDIDEEAYQHYWSYISHFIHTPFYVYAYAFGDCLVNSLYATYEKGFPHFQETYLEMLKAGGSKSYQELLGMFGLDASQASFWQQGLSMIEGFIHRLEAL